MSTNDEVAEQVVQLEVNEINQALLFESFSKALHDLQYIMPVVLTVLLAITTPITVGLVVTWVVMLGFHYTLVFNNEVNSIRFTLD